MISMNSYTTIYDEVAGIKYFAFNSDGFVQWVSYDDVITLQQKVTFASNQGYERLQFHNMKDS